MTSEFRETFVSVLTAADGLAELAQLMTKTPEDAFELMCKIVESTIMNDSKEDAVANLIAQCAALSLGMRGARLVAERRTKFDVEIETLLEEFKG